MTISITNQLKEAFYNNQKDSLKNKNIVLLIFFDNKIELKSSSTIDEEYFFTDTKNYLKRKIFKDTPLCGSNAIINTDRNILVRNGEYRPNLMLEYLKPETWNSIFKE